MDQVRSIIKKRRHQGSTPVNRPREFREYEGMTQLELVSISKVNNSTISEIENQQRTVGTRVHSKLCYGLNKNPNKRDPSHTYQPHEVFPDG